MTKYYKKELGRREFFKKAFAAGTLAALAPSVLTSKETEKLPEKEVKVTKLKPLGDVSILRKFDPSAKVWLDIAYVNAIDLPMPEPIDVTTLDSELGYREFIAGHRRSTKISIDAAFSEYTWGIIKSDFDNDIVQKYEILIPDSALFLASTSLEFMGFITEIPLTFPHNDGMGCSIDLEVIDVVHYNDAKQ